MFLFPYSAHTVAIDNWAAGRPGVSVSIPEDDLTLARSNVPGSIANALHGPGSPWVTRAPAVVAAPRFLGFPQVNWKVGVDSAPYPGHSCPGDTNLDWKVSVGDGDGEGHGDSDGDYIVD